MPQPLITVITPVFNAATTVEQVILSVAGQNYASKEHIFIDNMSTDGTLAILESYTKQFDHIRVISEKDEGIYDAMNKGIDLACGEWIYFLGSDDQFSNENILQQIIDHIFPDFPDVVYGNVYWGNTNKIYDGKFSYLKLLEKNICHQAIFFNREIFRKLGKFDLRYSSLADYVFNIRWFTDPTIRCQYVDTVVAKFNIEGFSAKHHDSVFYAERDSIIEKYFPEEYASHNRDIQYKTHEIENFGIIIKDLKAKIIKSDSALYELQQTIIENSENYKHELRKVLDDNREKELVFIENANKLIENQIMLDKAIDGHTAENRRINQLLHKQELEISRLNQLVIHGENKLQELISSFNNELNIEKGKFRSKGEEISGLHQTLLLKEDEISGLHQTIKFTNEDINDYKKKLAKKELIIQENENQNSGLLVQLNEQNMLIEEKRKQILANEIEIANVHNSMSWRITGSLRALHSLLIRIFKPLCPPKDILFKL